ncbi:MAG: spore maturation protein [Chloroflexota bacterium]
MSEVARFIVPGVIVLTLVIARIKRVAVYEAFVEGAADGIKLVISIFPYLLAMYVAVGVFEAAGALEFLRRLLGPLFVPLALPVELGMLMLIRPVSGGAAYGMVSRILSSCGADSLAGKTASVLQGSSDTTFYVVSLYSGSVGARKTGHAIPLCLLGDVTGFVAGVLLSRLFFN